MTTPQELQIKQDAALARIDYFVYKAKEAAKKGDTLSVVGHLHEVANICRRFEQEYQNTVTF